ncbi:hypothetical protein GYA54_01490 [Candidatus Kuenenbacteria bacterium]|nr:hypothetical protein [Candidatus Kuenenbacteria bacterium]
MPYFEGKEFSTIFNEMPARSWDRKHFLSDWQRQMADAGTMFNEDDIKMATKIVLSSLYDSYEQCVEMINKEESLSLQQKQKTLSRLNLAMTNLLEFGQRSNQNIARSLADRKLSKAENGGEFFNDIIDLLIQELDLVSLEFHQKQEEFYNKKRRESPKKL